MKATDGTEHNLCECCFGPRIPFTLKLGAVKFKPVAQIKATAVKAANSQRKSGRSSA